jgi:hypothetical protein
MEVGCVLFDGRTSQAAFEQSHTAKATAIFKMSISRHPNFVSEVKYKIDCERRQDLDWRRQCTASQFLVGLRAGRPFGALRTRKPRKNYFCGFLINPDLLVARGPYFNLTSSSLPSTPLRGPLPSVHSAWLVKYLPDSTLRRRETYQMPQEYLNPLQKAGPLAIQRVP